MTTGSSLASVSPEFLVVGPKESACTEIVSRVLALGVGFGKTQCISVFLQSFPDCLCDFVVFAIPPDQIETTLPSISLARERHPFMHLVVALERYDDATACRAFRAGASEVLDFSHVTHELQRWRHGTSFHSPNAPDAEVMGRWIGTSASARHLRSWLPQVAATDCNVLITGETGSGKELVAELIHAASRRSKRRLVCVNCAAVPETLIESELFGHERGSFTGALTSREGLLEAANGGTIFLDEIGEMTPLAQAKVLRVLETRQVQKVGSVVPKQLDLRLVAATNQPLISLVESSRFRKDLLYRLKVVEVKLLPLRQHPEDIPALLKHFLRYFNRKYGGSVAGFSAAAMRSLMAHEWPGNVRELRNVVECLFVQPRRARVNVEDLPLPGPGDTALSDRQQLLEALASVKWNKSAAARILKWSRMTLYRKIAKYEIQEVKSAGTSLVA
jgi:DNA-binding NtrC family response regulator